MCRALARGGRRCPYHSDERIMSMYSAQTSVRRWERKLDASEQSNDDQKMDHALDKLGAAMVRLRDREQARAGTSVSMQPPQDTPATFSVGEPHPTRAGRYTTESVAAMSWDELADEHSRLHSDPAAQDRLEELMDEREANEREEIGRYEDDPHTVAGEREAAYQELGWDASAGDDAMYGNSARQISKTEEAQERYFEYVCAQHDRAEKATNGFMVTAEGRAKGYDGFTLFRSNTATIKKYGTPELQGFFAVHGRHTLGSFRWGMYHWQSDQKAYERYQAEDYGHAPMVTGDDW